MVKVLVLHVVNTDSSEQPATIFLNNFAKRKKQVQVFALSGALNAENLQDNPEAIGTRKTIIDLPDTGNSTYTFASIVVYDFKI
jgi:hypothetical protein